MAGTNVKYSEGSVTREVEASSANGYVMFVVSVALILAVPMIVSISRGNPGVTLFGIFVGVLGLFSFRGLYMLQPNQAALLPLFGRYQAPIAMPACGGPILSARAPSSRCARAISTATRSR